MKQAQAGETQYTVFSLWDTFRAFHPLMTILQPKQNGAWMGSLLRMYEEGGLLPKWPLAANYTGTMVGYPATAVLADAMAKGLEGFDYELALEASVFASEYHPEVLRNITEPRAAQVMPKQLAFLNQLGFIPHDSITHSVSYGLECAYYDWCIAQMATQLGKDSLAALYRSRARGYQTYFDPEIGFMRGKMADGSWQTPFNPNHSDHDNSPFVEGNAWQWSWFVPHDVAGMAELLGGEAAFARKLDQLFTTEAEVEGENASADITGLIGQYAHGNEPSHHVIHFYNYLGQPWKTQEKIDQVLRELYAPTPAGISGNEDCGAMSAWYVLNALGFYQLSPGDPTYTLTRPLVDEAEFRLANGKTFRIEVQNNAPEHLYIQQAWLNGEALATPFFTHEQLMQGGELTFRMGADKKMATR
ncbi:MAG: glycoside hydrolase family 92 protein [Bacteroidota bacterium]